MKSILMSLVTALSVGAFADAPKMSCDWTDAQGTQILKNFASIIYKSVEPSLIAKGLAIPENVSVTLYKDNQTSPTGEAYFTFLVGFNLVDGTEMLISTDSTSHSIPLNLFEQNDPQGQLSGCEVQTSGLVIRGVLNAVTHIDVLDVNEALANQTVLKYAPNPVE